MKFKDKLKALGACREAVEWVGARGAQRAWNECERADWMLWLAAKTLPRETVVLMACDCAATALKYAKGTVAEAPAQNAIEAARAWARGKASVDEVRRAAAAAYAAADATATAAAAAYAAADAAYAAAVATAAAYAAAAVATADAAARRNAHLRMCKLVRKRQPKVPKVVVP